MALVFVFLYAPIVLLIIFSFNAGNSNTVWQGFSLEWYEKLFRDRLIMQSVYTTLLISLLSTIIATVAGTFAAIGFYSMRRRIRDPLMTVNNIPMMNADIVTGVSLCLFFVAFFNFWGDFAVWFNSLQGVIQLPTRLTMGFGTLLIAHVCFNIPYVILSVGPKLRQMDKNLVDAAQDLGCTWMQAFWKVIIPEIKPGIISGALLVFIQSLEDFSNPATIGGDYTTLSIEVYNIITGSYDMRKGSVLALLLLLPAVIAYLLNKYWVNKKSFVTVTGKPTQARKLIEEPHIKWPLFAFCLIVSAIIILFYGTVIFASFVRTWGVDFSLTLDQYRKALQYGWDSLKNSMTLGLISAVIGGLLGMVIAYITAKRNYFGKRFIEVSSVLMFAVPGTVLGISYILGFNSKPLALTGTGIILVIVFTFRNMPVAIESGTTTLLQIDNSIEEASTILGADTGYSFRRITLPMLKNAFFSGIVYSFTKAITAVSAVIFLVSPRWKLVTSNIYSLFDMAKYGQAAAFVTMMVGILLVFIGLFNTVINFLLAPRSKVPQAKTKTEESK